MTVVNTDDGGERFGMTVSHFVIDRLLLHYFRPLRHSRAGGNPGGLLDPR
jgi:hypothetical protein